MELTKEQLDQIRGIVSEVVKASNVEMTKAFDAKITEAVTPITSRVEQVEGKVKAAPPATPPASTDPLAKPATGGDNAVIQTLVDSINKLTEKVEGVVSERDAEKSKSAARRLVDETVAKKYPNLKGKPAVMAKLYAAEPKDEAALDALVESEKAYAAALGLDTKVFGSDPATENGKPGEGSDSASEEEKAKAKAEDIKKRRLQKNG